MRRRGRKPPQAPPRQHAREVQGQGKGIRGQPSHQEANVGADKWYADVNARAATGMCKDTEDKVLHVVNKVHALQGAVSPTINPGVLDACGSWSARSRPVTEHV